MTSDAPLRPHAEEAHAAELAALAAGDDRPRPPQWRLSPQAVVTFLMGGVFADGTVVTPKYVGDRRLMEVAVATLATDRALLLLGVPGTAKTWVSEHLAPVADALERAATNPETMGLAISLADLARTRLGMIEELTP